MKNCKSVVFTDCSTRTMKQILSSIRKNKPLTKDEEHDLWEKMKAGSMAARDLLIKANQGFVMSRAKQWTWTGMEQEDLFQIGTMGLIEATDRFDASTGNSLISYAVWWIDCELKKAVTNHLKYSTKLHLEDKAFAVDDCDLTLQDMQVADYEYDADWDIRYDTAFKEIKAMVEKKFFAEAANLWEDHLVMRELGYTISDVAKRYNVTEERAKDLIKKINQYLGKRYKLCG